MAEARDEIGRTVNIQDNLTVEDLVKALDQNEISVKPNEAELEMVRNQEEYNKTGEILKKNLEKLVKQAEGQQKALENLNDKLAEAMKLNEQYRDKKDNKSPEEKEYYKKAVKKGSIYVHDEGAHQLLKQMIPLLSGGLAAAQPINFPDPQDITDIIPALQKSLAAQSQAAEASEDMVSSINKSLNILDTNIDNFSKALNKSIRSIIGRRGEIAPVTGPLTGAKNAPEALGRRIGAEINRRRKPKEDPENKDLEKLIKSQEAFFGMDVGTRAKEKFRSVGNTLVSEKASGVDVADKLIRAMNLERFVGGVFRLTGDAIGKTLTKFLPETFGKLSRTVGGFLGGLAEVSASIFLEPLLKQLQVYSDIRQVIDQTTRALGKTNEEIQNESISFDEILQTGQDINSIQREWIKNWKRGIQELGKTKKVLTTGLSTASLLGSSVSETSDMFADWHQNLRMTTGELGIMGRGLVEISKSTGVTGDNLIKVAKTSEQIMKSMKDAGTFTTDYGKNITRILAEASKVGASDTAKNILDILQGGLAFGGGDEGLKNFLTLAGADAGGDILNKMILGKKLNPNEFKGFAKGIENTIQDIIDSVAPKGTKFENLNVDQREAVAFQTKARFGDNVKVEAMLNAVDAIRKGSRTFSEILEDLTQQEKDTLSAKKKEQIEQEKNLLITHESIDLFSKYNDLLKIQAKGGPNAFKQFMKLPGTKESLNALNVKGEKEAEVLESLLQPIIDDLNRKIIDDDQLFKNVGGLFGEDDVKKALAGGNKGVQALLDDIESTQKQIAIQQKANLDPVKKLEFSVDKLSGAVQILASELLVKLHKPIMELIDQFDKSGLLEAIRSGDFSKINEAIERGFTKAGEMLSKIDWDSVLKPVWDIIKASLGTILDFITKEIAKSLAGIPILGELAAGLAGLSKETKLLVAGFGFLALAILNSGLITMIPALGVAISTALIGPVGIVAALVGGAILIKNALDKWEENFKTQANTLKTINNDLKKSVDDNVDSRQKKAMLSDLEISDEKKLISAKKAQLEFAKKEAGVGFGEKLLPGTSQARDEVLGLIKTLESEISAREASLAGGEVLRKGGTKDDAKMAELMSLIERDRTIYKSHKEIGLAKDQKEIIEKWNAEVAILTKAVQEAQEAEANGIPILGRLGKGATRLVGSTTSGEDIYGEAQGRANTAKDALLFALKEYFKKEGTDRQLYFGEAVEKSKSLVKDADQAALSQFKAAASVKDMEKILEEQRVALFATWQSTDNTVQGLTKALELAEQHAKNINAFEQEKQARLGAATVDAPGRQFGTNMVLEEGLAHIHKGEAILPAGIIKMIEGGYQDTGPFDISRLFPVSNLPNVEARLPNRNDPEAEIKRRRLEAEERNKPVAIESDDLSSIEETNRTVADKMVVVAELLKDIKTALTSKGRRRGGSGTNVQEEPYNDGILDTEWVQARFDELSPGIGGNYTDSA